MDPTSIGTLGTLVFLSTRQPEKVVTAYPIDSPLVTIGRDAACDIRLYYPDVSPVHAKLIFEGRKAFIVVLGTHGALVDDCAVFPAPVPASGSSSSSSPAKSKPTTIPLSNDSTLEIHGKRFRFSYPPKHARAAAAAALSTPARPGLGLSTETPRRRLSVITAAKVFYPAPSPVPLENLRVLQSPLRPYAGVVRQPSPLRGRGVQPAVDEEEEVEDEEVVLVEGDRPKVVQEDKDLVILEDLPPISGEETKGEGASGSPKHIAPQAVRETLQTPPRKKAGPRGSLHRAVLIRTAQRVQQDVVEEMEVEESMLVNEDPSDESDVLADEEDEYEEGEEEVLEEAYERVNDDEQKEKKSGWRKSLEMVWPFGRKSQEPEEVPEEEDEQNEEDDQNMFDGQNGHNDPNLEPEVQGLDDDDDMAQPEPEPELESAHQPAKPVVPSTPQALNRTLPPGSPLPPPTLGHRMPMHTPRRAVDAWRVRDLVIPPPAPNLPPPTPNSTNTNLLAPTPAGYSHTPRKVSVEEEKAIRDRRRTSLAPLSPLKPSNPPGLLHARSHTFPSAASTVSRSSASTGSSAGGSENTSPDSIADATRTTTAGRGRRAAPRESEESDSGALLESMRRTVDDLRRRSIGATLPAPSLAAGDAVSALASRTRSVSPAKTGRGRISLFAPPKPQEGRMQGLDFSRLDTQQEKGKEKDRDMDVDNDEEAQKESEDSESESDDDMLLEEKENAPLANSMPPPRTNNKPPSFIRPANPSKASGSGSNQPATPHLDSLRHMFRAPAPAGASTPALAAVRGLYRKPQEPATPALEGVAELLATPAAPAPPKSPKKTANKPPSRSRTRDVNVEEPPAEDVSMDEAPQAAKPPSKTTTKPPSKSRVHNKDVEEPIPVVEDVSMQGPPKATKPSSRTGMKPSSRSKVQDTGIEESTTAEDVSMEEAPQKSQPFRPRSTSRGTVTDGPSRPGSSIGMASTVPVTARASAMKMPSQQPARPPSRTSTTGFKPTSASRPAPSTTTAKPVRSTTPIAPALARAKAQAQATPDAATLADDELTPVVAPGEAPKRSAGVAVSKAASSAKDKDKAAAEKEEQSGAKKVVKRRGRPPGYRPHEVESSGSSRPPSRGVPTPDIRDDDEDEEKPIVPKRTTAATSKSTKPSSKTTTTAAAATEPSRRTRQTTPSTSSQPIRRSTRSTPAKDADSASESENTTRSKKTAARGKAPAVESVKEEEEDTDVPPPRAPSRNAAASKGSAGSSAASASRTRASARKGIGADEVVDKENTPDGLGKVEESEDVGVKKSATRARTTKTAAAVAKEKDVPTGPAKAARVTRTKK